MDRLDYYFRQLVAESELDAGFDHAEAADRAMMVDLGLNGIMSGLGVIQAVAPAISVQVEGGRAYDTLGQRLYVPATQFLSLALDSNGVSTAVGSPGNAKVVSVFLSFSRANTDPRTDGNSVAVYFRRSESFTLVVRQGAEATEGSEVAPTLESEMIHLADIKRIFGQTQILNADINPTVYANRRQDAFVGTLSTLLDYRVGTLKEAINLIRDQVAKPIITPATISGNVTDYGPTGFSTARIIRQEATAAANLRSMASRGDGECVKIFNISLNTSYTITLKHQDGAGTAGLRFMCPNLADHIIRAGGGVACTRDGTTGAWRVEAS